MHSNPPCTIIDVLQNRAAADPSGHAYTFLNDGYKEADSLGYLELDTKARAIAGYLQSLNLQGERALLIYSPGLDFITAFLGSLYAGVIPIPFPAANPAQPDRSLPKLQAIAADAKPAIILTVARLRDKLVQAYAGVQGIEGLTWLDCDELAEENACRWKRPEIDVQAVAYLQYTSGSTSQPKGVMVTHANVIHSLDDMHETWSFTPGSVMVSWLPHYHDLGLVYGILAPLYKGIPCYLMAPVAFVQRPIRWLEAISRYKGTHSAAPNFAYELCLRRITAEQMARLDLSSWRVTVDGAEPVRKQTIDRFTDNFEPCGFRAATFCPAYGLAEATLKVCTALPDEVPSALTVRSDELKANRVVITTAEDKGTQTLVSCGRVVLQTEVAIVKPDSLAVCGDDEVGEIWVRGPLVTAGYWNRPKETRELFNAFTAEPRQGPFLRTGDLGFIRNGEIYITGRLKDLIIIAGRNHYPQDIELTVESCHEAIKPGGCAAFSVDVNGEEQLILAVEIDRRYRWSNDHDVSDNDSPVPISSGPHATRSKESIVRAIRIAVSYYHEVDVYQVLLLKTGGVPKTSSGKTQRHACRNGFLEGRLALWEGAA